MTIHANVVNTAITSGIPLDWWTKVTSSMISKLEGQARIDKLRIIHGDEADYNGLLKMAAASGKKRDKKPNNEPLPRGGGQKGRQANHIVLLKEMKYMNARLRKHNMATMDNDAKACYDRIIMSLATIVSWYYGLPRNTRKLQAKAIRAMQFHIKTVLGVSKDYYQDTLTTPLHHGSGQGSGSASTLWLFISLIIMTIYQDLASGMQITNANITEKLQEWIDGYVDDTSIFTNIDETQEAPTATTIAQQLQNDASSYMGKTPIGNGRKIRID
jgi:hypothetical protein